MFNALKTTDDKVEYIPENALLAYIAFEFFNKVKNNPRQVIFFANDVQKENLNFT